MLAVKDLSFGQNTHDDDDDDDDKIEMTEMGRTCSTYGTSRNAYRVLVGKPEGKRHLGRPRRRWEDNIKMDLREVGCDTEDWIDLAENRDQWRAYARAVIDLRVP